MTREKSRAGISKKLLVSALAAALLVVAFSQLSLRKQGRIVEFFTLGDWPLEWAIRWQFDKKQPELRAIIDFVNEAPEVTGLRVTPLGLWASLGENKGEKHNLDEPNILQALISIEAQLVNVREDRVGVFLGSETRGSVSFEAGYVYPLKSIEMPDCEAIVASERDKIGGCGFRLNSNWYAVYKWYPEDIDELEKALDELK